MAAGRTGYSTGRSMLTIGSSLVSLTRTAKGHGEALPVFIDAAVKPEGGTYREAWGGQPGGGGAGNGTPGGGHTAHTGCVINRMGDLHRDPDQRCPEKFDFKK